MPPGEENGNSLQYSCLESSLVGYSLKGHKSWTRLVTKDTYMSNYTILFENSLRSAPCLQAAPNLNDLLVYPDIRHLQSGRFCTSFSQF